MGLIGRPVRRIEDHGLVTGAARFAADQCTESLVVCFVRATMAHARIVSVDTAAAEVAAGVVATVTAATAGDVTGLSSVPVPDGIVRPLLAPGVVRFVGEIVAAVVAGTEGEAEDAAALVVVDYEPLPAVPDLDAALDPGATLLFDGFESNVVLAEGGPAEDGFGAGAAVIVEIEIVNQRVAVAPLETNSILACPDGDGLVVHVSTQVPHAVRDTVAALCGLEASAVRVVAGWVGGGFGAKSITDPEYVLVCRLALQLGRPVRWLQTRTDNLLTMHGRGQRQRVQIAAGRDGTLRSLHADLVSDGGAFPGMNHFLAGLTARMLSGTYRLAEVSSSITSVATNTASPVGYRGAGRPEAACLVERVVDIVAAELGIDPVELRRRNLIPPEAFPYTTPTGVVYDCGDYRLALDRAVDLARYDERRAEQAARRIAGHRTLLGIGVSCYVEVTAGAGPTEFADVEVAGDGSVTVRVGTFGHGQGHHTTFAQIAADGLAVPMDAVRVIEGDTREVARGFGTFGSRSIQVGGAAVRVACERVVEAARALSSELLEAAPEDIVHDGWGFSVAGVPTRCLSWSELAARATVDGERPGLWAAVDWERPASTFPFGAHVAIVEVDRETGAVRLVEHVAVDDCGTVINPLLAEGQVHGGIAQGAAQALLEEMVYDDSGNVLTSTFTDYAFPSAAELPSYTLDRTVTPTPINSLGAKGIGESGTIGATPAVHNAVVDALAHLGVRHLDMPCTPERVWRAINGKRHPILVTRPESGHARPG